MSKNLLHQRALVILPHLIRYAQLRKTVTYKTIAEIINVNPHTELPGILGYIRDTFCDPGGFPRINAIVINARTGKPGDGFIPEGAGHLSDDLKQQKYEQFRDEAFLFENWNDLLNSLNLEPVSGLDRDFDEEVREYNKILSKRGGEGGEGKEHLQLKEYLATYPQNIGIQAIKRPEKEHEFPSMDKCDILVELNGNRSAIIEVKVRLRGELIKGIYQLVKYRALLEAEKTHGGSYPVELHLAAYDIPKDIQEFARKFDITCHVISEKIFRNKIKIIV